MHALRTPSFFRPSSRSASPAPAPMPTAQPITSISDPGMAFDSLPTMSRPASRGPLNRLALTSKRRSTTSTPSATPTLVQDGSYLEALSLKLSEAVSKALAHPSGAPAPGEVVWNGRRALPKGRGKALGALILSELEAASSNLHLMRAILRSLHKPLSALLANVSTQLLPVLSSAQFTAHPTPSAPSPAQLYAVSYATFIAELLESLDGSKLMELDGCGSHGTAENLRHIREGLESLIGRVINPLGQGIKNELLPLIETLEHNKSPLSSPTLTKQNSVPHKGGLHPSVVSLQTLIPAHARYLVCLTNPPTSASQTMLATLLIAVIWRSLIALSHRAPVAVIPPQITANAQSGLMSGTLRKKRGNTPSPATTPPASRFAIKLPPSRPPSPPMQPYSPANDAKALFELFKQLPQPKESSKYALAREAVEEAYSGLAGLCALLDCEARGEVEDLENITNDLPTVIALPILLRMFAIEAGSVAAMLGVTEEEYRNACLSGFGRAEECGPLVAKRVLDTLERQEHLDDRFAVWLEHRASLT
ncbi:hypothetical protein M422DRAFT_27948, partial [Sphaerobolus stellatus SS14]